MKKLVAVTTVLGLSIGLGLSVGLVFADDFSVFPPATSGWDKIQFLGGKDEIDFQAGDASINFGLFQGAPT